MRVLLLIYTTPLVDAHFGGVVPLCRKIGSHFYAHVVPDCWGCREDDIMIYIEQKQKVEKVQILSKLLNLHNLKQMNYTRN